MRAPLWVVAAAVGFLLGCGAPPAAIAGWGSPSAVRQTGTFGMPVASWKFSGPTAASYTINFSVLSFNDTDYPVLTNTGTTPASFSGQISASGGLPLASTVLVQSCSVPWVGGNCGGSLLPLLPSIGLTPVPTLSYQVTPIPAGANAYLKVKVGGFLATATVTLLVTRALLPVSAANRTAG